LTKERAVLANHQAAHVRPNGEQWFDQPTALKVVDDAEDAGLITLGLDFAYLEDDGIRVPLNAADWSAIAGGDRAVAVRATAAETRKLIEQGFPDGTDVALFDFG
jgi:hypothetical protein